MKHPNEWQYQIDHREPITHSLMKYSWNRSSLVSSGWKVVKKCSPWRSATKVLGSSEWSANDAGRRLGDSCAMTLIGGSKGDGFNSRTTWEVKDVIKAGNISENINHLPAHGWIFLCTAGQDSEVRVHISRLQKIQSSLSLDNEIRKKFGQYLRSPSVSSDSDRHSA